MEGFMYRCHPQIPALLDLIKDKIIGDVKKITSSFGFDMAKIIPEHRLFNKDLGGGVVKTEIHEIDFLASIFGLPHSIKAYGGCRGPFRLDVEDSAEIFMDYGFVMMIVMEAPALKLKIKNVA